MTVSVGVMNYAARGTHGFRVRRAKAKITPASPSVYLRNNGLQGIEEVRGVGVLYKYRDNYVLDFSKLQGNGLGALNIFGITIPSITLPSPNQVIQTVTNAYTVVKNTSAAVQNAVIKTASTAINTSAQLATKGIQTLQSTASTAVNNATTALNTLKSAVATSINTFSKTIIEPAKTTAAKIGGSAGQAALNTLNTVLKAATSTGSKIISTGQAAVNTLQSSINAVGQTAVNVVQPIVTAVGEGITGVTNDMIAKVKQTASDLSQIEALLIKLSTSKNPVTQAALKNFNSLYGSALSKAKSNLPSAKKEAGISIPILIAIPVIIGIAWIVHEALVYLEKLAEAPANEAQAQANVLTATANLTDAETKSTAVETASGAVIDANKTAEEKKAAAEAAKNAAEAKQTEVQLGEQQINEIVNAFNDKQTQIDSLNQQIANMQAQGIDPNDPNFLAVVNALNNANVELENLKIQKQATEAEMAKDKADFVALQNMAVQASQDAQTAYNAAVTANQNFNSLVESAQLPSEGYAPTTPAGAAAAGTDIFAMFNNPIALLAAGGLLVMVLKK